LSAPVRSTDRYAVALGRKEHHHECVRGKP
jgi:hypothetical protein